MTTQDQSIRNIFDALKGRRSTTPGPSAQRSFEWIEPRRPDQSERTIMELDGRDALLERLGELKECYLNNLKAARVPPSWIRENEFEIKPEGDWSKFPNGPSVGLTVSGNRHGLCGDANMTERYLFMFEANKVKIAAGLTLDDRSVPVGRPAFPVQNTVGWTFQSGWLPAGQEFRFLKGMLGAAPQYIGEPSVLAEHMEKMDDKKARVHVDRGAPTGPGPV